MTGAAGLIIVISESSDRLLAGAVAATLARRVAEIERCRVALVDATEVDGRSTLWPAAWGWRSAGKEAWPSPGVSVLSSGGEPWEAVREGLGATARWVVACVPAAAALPQEATSVVVAQATPSPRLARQLTAFPAGSVHLVVPEAPARPTRREQRTWRERMGGVGDVVGLGAAGTKTTAEPWIDRGCPAGRALAALVRAILGRRIGVALGSGGPRGFAHVGALEALAGLGVPADVMAGSSAGAGIGGVWALGDSGDWIADHFAGLETAMRWAVPLRSLLRERALYRHMVRGAAGRGFDDMRLRFGVVAVDLETGDEVVLESGELARAVLASCAFPGLLPPVRLDGRCLVDGGLLKPVPVEATRRLGAGRVIAVDLSSPGAPAARPSVHLLGTLRRAVALMYTAIERQSAAGADVHIRVARGGEAVPAFRDFRAGRAWRERGYQAVLDARPALEAAIPELGPEAWISPRLTAALAVDLAAG